jgi:hypothetical protein
MKLLILCFLVYFELVSSASVPSETQECERVSDNVDYVKTKSDLRGGLWNQRIKDKWA